jgi:hypothetical protein
MGEVMAKTQLLPPFQGRVDVDDAKDRNHLSHSLPPCRMALVHDACRTSIVRVDKPRAEA